MEENKKDKYNIFAIFVFNIMMLLFLVAWEKSQNFENFLTGNVIPELIGICIELLIIIFVFEKWQTNKEHKKTIVYEKRLRKYLIFFLTHGLSELPDNLKIGNFYGYTHQQNKQEIKKIIDYLNQNEISLNILKKIHKHLQIDKTAFENLLEVAALLSDEHFKSWIRIVYYINKLETLSDTDVKEYKVTIMLILREINRFDTASYEHKVYVGSNI